MPEPHFDPFDALRAPITPLAPDPTFAAALHDRLVRARSLFDAVKEPFMTIEAMPRPRNGFRHGDVSYISLSVPDLAKARAFYARVLRWSFSPGSNEQGAQVNDIIPMVGLWDGDQPDGVRRFGAVLGFRVDDIAIAVASVRAHGGTVNEPHAEPYGLAAEGHDDQGIPFYLHEMPIADRHPGVGGLVHNGEVEGDVSYLTMIVTDVSAAHAFYNGVFGWTFNIGQAGGTQVTGVAPQVGMTTEPEEGPATPGVIMCYRVDDIAAAVERVRAAAGRARDAITRPYGLESLCIDDQGLPFYLHQL